MASESPSLEPGPEVAGAPQGMVELGTVLGAGVWWCEQSFAVVGAWVPTTSEAAVRVHLAEMSRVLGDHAHALRRHLPRPNGFDPEAWVAGPDGSEAVVARLDGLDDTIGRLAGLHRVLVPRLLVAWTAHRDGASIADRGVRRSLRHACADVGELHLAGEAILQALLAGDVVGARRAGDVVGEIESLLVASGGLVPPPRSDVIDLDGM